MGTQLSLTWSFAPGWAESLKHESRVTHTGSEFTGMVNLCFGTCFGVLLSDKKDPQSGGRGWVWRLLGDSP